MFGTGYGKLIVGVVGRIRMLFLEVSKVFWRGIKDGRKQWQMRPWNWFLQPQRVERDKEVAAK